MDREDAGFGLQSADALRTEVSFFCKSSDCLVFIDRCAVTGNMQSFFLGGGFCHEAEKNAICVGHVCL